MVPKANNHKYTEQLQNSKNVNGSKYEGQIYDFFLLLLLTFNRFQAVFCLNHHSSDTV